MFNWWSNNIPSAMVESQDAIFSPYDLIMTDIKSDQTQ